MSKASPTIPFEQWRESCMQQNDLSGEAKALREDAKSVFGMLFSATKIMDRNGNTVMETKSSHNELLAQLIKELDPCFSKECIHVNRVWALNCLDGAVEGCETLSFPIFKLLGTFLLSYCSPLEEEADFSEDTEEIVRDAAVSCLKSLIETPVEENDTVLTNAEVIQQRVTFAQTGVTNRCASDDDSPVDFDDQGYSLKSSADFRGGLSLLPRSRRSLCFSLIRATVDGIGTIQLDGPVEDDDLCALLSDFTKFATNCLHGESDPRCLMQLLAMLNALMSIFLPFFNSRKDTFPTIAIFDAVAPYYPIQFTPPPNNKYGITRSGLQQALMGILTTNSFDSKGDRESMLNLACGVVLERLIPSSDNAPTDEEKLETIEDLILLLRDQCYLLSPESTRELSNALMAAHSEGSSGVAFGKSGPQKSIADACRTLVSMVAAELEVSDLWEIFVQEPIQNDAPILATSPQSTKGRNTIAYFACLAASGGHRSLKFTFEQCMPQLITALKEDGDEDKISAAALGIGAYFSSYQVAVERSGGKLCLNPHPLQPYSAAVLDILADLFASKMQQPSIIAIYQAVVSLTIVTPKGILEDKDYQIITKFLEDSCSLVIKPKCDKDNDELRQKVAQSLGAMIGIANQVGSSSLLKTEERICDLINNNILSVVMKSAIEASTTSDAELGIVSIAYACDGSEKVAKKVVNELMGILFEKLKSGEHQDVLRIAKAVGIILKEGGNNAKLSFHSAEVDPVDIIKIVGHWDDNPIQGFMKAGMSFLQLPQSEQELEEQTTATYYGHKVMSHFLHAYDDPLPDVRIQTLFDFVCHVLPPLSDWQTVQLGICLPLFARILQHNNLSENMTTKLNGMMEPLADLAIKEQTNTKTRGAAASSMFWIIYRHQSETNEDCMSNTALQESIFPEIMNRFDRLNEVQAETSKEKVEDLKNSLNLLAVVGSAAACRGHPSSTKMSNDIATFLIELALQGKSTISLSHSKVPSTEPASIIKKASQLAAASAYGTMISCEYGSPFWRQRILHLALKAMQADMAESNVDHFNCLGKLSLATHIAIKAKPSILSASSTSMLSKTLAKGMILLFKKDAGDRVEFSPETVDMYALQELILVVQIRLITFFPKEMGHFLDIMVPIALRILSQQKSIGLMILALQLLHTICNKIVNEQELIQFKTAVESILGDLSDHPSSLFRQMVVGTRNLWALLK